MSLRRRLASILLTLGVTTLLGAASAAQGPAAGSGATANGTGLLVSISGVTDVGGIFGGTLLVEGFTTQATGIAATGTVTGVLTAANGTGRNLVFKAALPLDIAGSRARLNTDPALAQSACDVLHVELAGASVNVLGSTIGLNPVAFDIASAIQTGATPTVTTTAPTTTAASPTVATTTPPAGTVTQLPSANATQATSAPFVAGTATPGATTAVPTTTTAAPASQTALGTLLCSVNNFRDTTNGTQLVQQLNGILAALAGG